MQPTTLAFTLALTFPLSAWDVPQTEKPRSDTRPEKQTCLQLLKSPAAEKAIPLDEVASTKKRLWARYSREQTADKRRREEHSTKKIRFGELTMRYEYTKVGEKSAKGYPLYIALHGGGNTATRVNDSQWRHMQRYYLGGVKRGVYVATRGMRDTWNLHSIDESYPCYDRLIENMILFENVDPDRVYVLGFSAGGDGIYQIAPRMADRFAAANMSAGHPNGVSPRNLFHVPFLLQVGERDRAYNRNRVAAQYFVQLQKLHKEHPDGYIHAANIHRRRPHNFKDNDAKMTPQEVIADPAAWLESREKIQTVTRNTNAIAWLDGFTRDPTPNRVLWDLRTTAPSRGEAATREFGITPNRDRLHYWLDLSGRRPLPEEPTLISARIVAKSNAIVVDSCGDWLRVLVTAEMLDLSREIEVRVGDQKLQVRAVPRLGVMLQTLLDRGDPNYMFEASVTLEMSEGKWRATGS